MATTYPAVPSCGVPMGTRPQQGFPGQRGRTQAVLPSLFNVASAAGEGPTGRGSSGASSSLLSEQVQVDLFELPGTPVAPREQLGHGCLPPACWGLELWKPQSWGYSHLEGSRAWFPMWPGCGCIAKQCPWQVVTPTPAQLHPKQIRCLSEGVMKQW